ncbi:MAG: hypothetical protein ACE5HP_11440 [Gemmatimonadota bacterium]
MAAGVRRTAARRRLLLGVLPVLIAMLASTLPVDGQQRGQRRQRRPPAEQRRPPQRDLTPQRQRAFDTPAGQLVDRFGDRAAQALHLSRSQTEQLKAVLQASRRERVALEGRQRQIGRELAELVRTGAADQGRVGQLFDELLRLRVQLAEVDVAENRRLSEFLSPLDRARLFHLKQRLAQRALEARVRRQGQRPQRP